MWWPLLGLWLGLSQYCTVLTAIFFSHLCFHDVIFSHFPLPSLFSSQATFIAPNLPTSSLRYMLPKDLPPLSPLSHSLPQQVHQLLIIEIPANLPLKAWLSHHGPVILSIVIPCAFLFFFLTHVGDITDFWGVRSFALCFSVYVSSQVL